MCRKVRFSKRKDTKRDRKRKKRKHPNLVIIVNHFRVENSKWTNFPICPLVLSSCLLWTENRERIQVWPDFEKQLPDGRLWRHMAPNVSMTTQIRIWYSFRTKRGESRSDIYLKHRTSEKLLRRRESLSKGRATPASTPKSGAAPRITSCPPT